MKTAIITGTSSGLGEAFAKTLLDLGWKVYGISRRENVELVNHSNFRQLLIDLAKPIDFSLLTKEIGEKKIDLLVNNAGFAQLHPAKDWDQDLYEKMFAVHYIAPLQLLNYFAQKLENGMVISTLSSATHIGWDELAYYGASKAALWLHMKSFSRGNPSITCINLHPCTVTTELTDNLGDYFDEEEREKFMSAKDITTIFLQLVTGVLSVNSGSSIFIHNDWEKLEMSDFGIDTYFYNTETESLEKK